MVKSLPCPITCGRPTRMLRSRFMELCRKYQAGQVKTQEGFQECQGCRVGDRIKGNKKFTPLPEVKWIETKELNMEAEVAEQTEKPRPAETVANEADYPFQGLDDGRLDREAMQALFSLERTKQIKNPKKVILKDLKQCFAVEPGKANSRSRCCCCGRHLTINSYGLCNSCLARAIRKKGMALLIALQEAWHKLKDAPVRKVMVGSDRFRQTITPDTEGYQKRLEAADRVGLYWHNLFVQETPITVQRSGYVKDFRPYWQIPAQTNGIKATCPCCLRHLKIKAAGLCGTCYNAAGQGTLSGPQLVDALLKARRRLQGQDVQVDKAPHAKDRPETSQRHQDDLPEPHGTGANLENLEEGDAHSKQEEHLKQPCEPTGEFEPTGRDPHEGGAKLDGGKNRLGLVLHGFARALWQVGLVGTGGAEKYSPNGWLEVPGGFERYTDASYRHRLLEAMGEQCDSDTGLLHAAHDAWNALARLELILRQREEKGDEQ